MLHVINDIHAGVVRSGGTTPATSHMLRARINAQLGDLLSSCRDGDLLINGDLLDTNAIPYTDLLTVFTMLGEWLSNNKGQNLYLSAGNHDLSKNSLILSSFQFLCKLLRATHGQRVVPIFEPTAIDKDNYVIPHLPNQDLFNEAIDAVPKSTKFLFLHCNFDNHFAVESDHSLNLSPEQAMKLKVKHIVIAHEHQRTSAINGKIVVVGNQFPSSVADCIGNDAKYRLAIDEGKIEWVQTWKAEGDFSRMDWRSLADDGSNFIRVEGNASAAEAADVAAAISRFRGKSEALVVTNAVKIEGVNDQADLDLSNDAVSTFDVYGALMEILDPEEQKVVKQLMKDNNVQTA